MADIIQKGVKHTIHVDLTPMVDLGFLLITFFILSTTLSKPKAMELQMPFVDNPPPISPSEFKESTAMTILLGANHQLYYYFGLSLEKQEHPELKVTSFTDEVGIRDAIIEKKKQVQQDVAIGKLDKDDQISILIKASDAATADDFVSLLDEMSINKIEVYTVADPNEFELKKMWQ